MAPDIKEVWFRRLEKKDFNYILNSGMKKAQDLRGSLLAILKERTGITERGIIQLLFDAVQLKVIL